MFENILTCVGGWLEKRRDNNWCNAVLLLLKTKFSRTIFEPRNLRHARSFPPNRKVRMARQALNSSPHARTRATLSPKSTRLEATAFNSLTHSISGVSSEAGACQQQRPIPYTGLHSPHLMLSGTRLATGHTYIIIIRVLPN